MSSQTNPSNKPSVTLPQSENVSNNFVRVDKWLWLKNLDDLCNLGHVDVLRILVESKQLSKCNSHSKLKDLATVNFAQLKVWVLDLSFFLKQHLTVRFA